MPVDAQVAPLLDLFAAVGLFADLAVTPADVRAMTSAGDTVSEVEVAEVRNLTIPGGDGQDMAVRIYRPAGAAESSPAVAYFHGGGWVIGSIDSHDDTCRRLANLSNFVFFSVEYRLAPEAAWPAAPDDCLAAVDWMRSNAAELGIDPSNVAVAGDSAGGNLAAVVALDAREKGEPLAAQLLIYPCTDMNTAAWPSMQENASGYFLTRDFMDWFYDHYAAAEERTNPRASPIHAPDLSGLPPALVITAEFDPLRDEGEAYADKLAAAGVDVAKTRYDGLIHGFFGLTDAIDRAHEAQAEAAAFLIATLGSGE